jgi:hypothetical protein
MTTVSGTASAQPRHYVHAVILGSDEEDIPLPFGLPGLR